MSWRVAKSLEKLRSQVNAEYPRRDKSSDGTIGDEKHASRSSDHNPWVKDGTMGVVTGMDITNDPDSGPVSSDIAEALKESRDPRIKYIISNARICSGDAGPSPWVWRKYSGSNAHRKHVHLSVKSEKALYDSVKPWSIVAKRAKFVEPVALVADNEPEPDDTKPHAAPASAPKSGITEGAQVAGGLTVAGLAAQVWEALSQAPDAILQALLGLAQKPAFLVALGVLGAVAFVWWQRRRMKKA
jgi:hypothetical protein